MKSLYLNDKDDLQKVFDEVEPFTEIYLEKGRYEGKFKLSVPSVTVIGCGFDTVLINNDYAKKLNGEGVEIGTFQTYTLAVTSDNVTLKNLTVENSAGSPEVLGQEVALSVYGNRFTAENCKFSSTQDTLFLGPLPDDLVVRYDGFLPDFLRYYEGEKYQKFVNCRIEGTVDFIFGTGNALFDKCDVVSLNDNRKIGYVAAPAHPLSCDIGFVFNNCRLLSENAPTVYLARAWRDFGKATFINCTYDDHVPEVGFINWNDTYREKTSRFYEYSPVFYDRAKWAGKLSLKEAEEFLLRALDKFDF